MRAGRYNNKVTIRQQAGTQDAAGQPTQTYNTVATPWADILGKNGAQTIQADKPTAAVQVSIRIRYRTDIAADMQVVHGATVYRIKAVLPDKRKREFVDLVCEAVDG